VDDLIKAFNSEVGNTGWVRARGVFLTALHDSLLATGLDCSSFSSGGGMSLDEKVERQGDTIVPIRGSAR
jgi:hypothetical protein